MKYKKSNIIYKLLKKSNKLIEPYFKDTKKLLMYIIFIILILIILTKYKTLFFTGLLILLGSISMIYVRYFRYSHYVAFELCTLATVLTSLSYGPHIGAMTGLISITGGFVISGHFKPTYFISVLVMPLIGLIVPFFRDLPLLYIGILITIIYDAIILPLYVIIGGSRIISSIIFFVTHVFLNAWVFATIAPILKTMMG